MKNFDTTRFWNYGKYDLTINQKFYRNAALAIVLILVGIAAMGFWIRWTEWKSMADNPMLDAALGGALSATGTEGVLLTAMSLILVILSGYVFHNLRTKQGRINELTLPATMKEKFTWHLVANIGGGLLLCIAGLLLADVVNAVLTAILLPSDSMLSLTGGVFDIVTMSAMRNIPCAVINGVAQEPATVYVNGLMLLFFSWSVLGLSIYVYGNSVKYHYNIILTYAIMQVALIVGMILLVMIGSSIAPHCSFCISPEDTPLLAKCILYGGSLIVLALTSVVIWRSYVRYSKAVVTSKRNK